MKRATDHHHGEEDDSHDDGQRQAACDLLLSLSGGSSSTTSSEKAPASTAPPRRRRRRRRGQEEEAFACRTCRRQFETFQALGGHRTSHLSRRRPTTKPTTKAHACATCGLRFSTGQALGGHMRRHRGVGPASPSHCHCVHSVPPPRVRDFEEAGGKRLQGGRREGGWICSETLLQSDCRYVKQETVSSILWRS
ncbi:hypothetical protein BS78_05G283400 [Paspalum vaginatum]|nr:hypothetical protein BS78_05G283400 [Paspalum vaginatum]